MKPDTTLGRRRSPALAGPHHNDEMPAADYEKLGLFYLGKQFDLATGSRLDDLVLYDSRDLLTHAVVVGMTGSGKTGLGISLIEEAAIDGIPVLAIDPEGRPRQSAPDVSRISRRPTSRHGSIQAKRGVTTRPLTRYAAEAAQRWKTGLAEWDQDGARIARAEGCGRCDRLHAGQPDRHAARDSRFARAGSGRATARRRSRISRPLRRACSAWRDSTMCNRTAASRRSSRRSCRAGHANGSGRSAMARAADSASVI